MVRYPLKGPISVANPWGANNGAFERSTAPYRISTLDPTAVGVQTAGLRIDEAFQQLVAEWISITLIVG